MKGQELRGRETTPRGRRVGKGTPRGRKVGKGYSKGQGIQLRKKYEYY